MWRETMHEVSLLSQCDKRLNSIFTTFLLFLSSFLFLFLLYNPLEMKILFTTMYTIYHLRKLLSSKFFLTTSMNNQLQKYLKRLTSLHGALERKASKFGNSKKRSLKAINLCLQELCY